MLKFLNRYTLSAMLILTIACQKTSAEVNLQPKLMCLERGQVENALICCEQNIACHEALKSSVAPPHADWEIVALSIAGGIIGGMILNAQLNH
jgi:hypothetical protein